MTDSSEEHQYLKPATRSEAAFIAADAVLALRHVQLALLALKRADDETFDKAVDRLEKQTDALWDRFQKLMGKTDV